MNYFFLLIFINILPYTFQSVISLKELQAGRKPVFKLPQSAPKFQGISEARNFSQFAVLQNYGKLGPAVGTGSGLLKRNESAFGETVDEIQPSPIMPYMDIVRTKPDPLNLDDSNSTSDLPDLKYIAYAWGINLTANRGKKPNCMCGHRRLEGAVPGKEIEWRRQWLNRRANPTPEPPKNAGSAEAVPNEFPWRVGLQGGPNGVFCGGSIIDNAWILTAARCLADLDRTTVFYVNAGDHDVTTVTETDHVVVKSNHWVIHPEYDPVTSENDIALVRLQRELQYRANIQPICLPYKLSDDDLYGVSVVAAGWSGSSGDEASPVMLKIDLPVLAPEVHVAMEGTPISENVFFTQVHGTVKDACEGDWGSTADLYDPDTGRYHAVGITSHGVSCGRPNKPRFYTKIYNYLEFIQNTTRAHFCVK